MIIAEHPARLAALLLLGLAGAACSAGEGSGDSRGGPKNLVIVALDTLRPDHLGCYGHERDTSPVLDAFAERSFLFRGAQTVAPWTAPSMISLMTSLHPDVHQVMGFPEPGRLGASVDTLAEILQRAGFSTAAFTEGGYAKGAFGLDQGFDLYPANAGDDESNTSNITDDSRLASNFDRFLPWLRDQGADQRFFAFFQTYEIHSPMRAPESFIQEFVPGYDEVAEHGMIRDAIKQWNKTQEVAEDAARVIQRHMVHCDVNALGKIKDRAAFMAHAAALGAPLTHKAIAEEPELLQWARDLYDAEIRYTDSQLQRLFDALEANGQADETVVIVVSDHGEGMGAHGLLGHGAVLHSELLDVVFLLHVPGGDFAPREFDYPARLIDVLPTALQLLDVAPGEAHFQGQSLVPLLAGDELPAPASYSHAVSRGPARHSVRKDPWRLIVEDESGAARLYDLSRDPGELRDVSAKHPNVVRELTALLTAQRAADEELRRTLGADLEESVIDEETLRDLERLGYTGQD